jgi:hypothetical protein
LYQSKTNRLNKNLWRIEQKGTVLVQNYAGSTKQSESSYPKLKIETKRTIALNFTGSNPRTKKIIPKSRIDRI